MDRWKQIELFVQVAELGSLSAAAEKLDVSNAAASRMLGGLEERLGARLIERTTRRLWLTEAGRDYHRRCVAVLTEMEEAEAAVNEATLNPRGTLRVASSVSFAMTQIAPSLPEFRKQYPNLSVQIVAANRYLSFMEAGIDVAIRTTEREQDSGITIRRLAQTRRILAASPSYCQTHGIPKTPEDLQGHQMLVYDLAVDPYVLHLDRDGEKRAIRIRSTLDSNEGQVICAAALAGLGILIQPLYIVHDYIRTGALVPILADWDLPRLTINLAYPSRRFQPAKIRAFTDFLIDRFATKNLEHVWTSVLA
jgi:DNA-binding transcriptional LysR family regulator